MITSTYVCVFLLYADTVFTCHAMPCHADSTVCGWSVPVELQGPQLAAGGR